MHHTDITLIEKAGKIAWARPDFERLDWDLEKVLSLAPAVQVMVCLQHPLGFLEP